MEAAALQKIAAHRLCGCGDFPFGFSCEARARPLRVCVGFVIAHVANWFVGLHPAPAGECVIPPLTVALLPIERCGPLICGESIPTVGEPKLRAPVAAVVNEFEIFATAHAAGSKLECLQINFVARLFVIECETGDRRVADLVNTF